MALHETTQQEATAINAVTSAVFALANLLDGVIDASPSADVVQTLQDIDAADTAAMGVIGQHVLLVSQTYTRCKMEIGAATAITVAFAQGESIAGLGSGDARERVANHLRDVVVFARAAIIGAV